MRDERQCTLHCEPEPQIVSIRSVDAKGSHAMFATEQRWCGVFTANKKRKFCTPRERTVVRDILTTEHRPRQPIGIIVVGTV